MPKDRSNVSVLIIVAQRKSIAGTWTVKAHIKTPPKAAARVATIGQATNEKQAHEMARKAKQSMIEKNNIPAANIKIRTVVQ